MTQLMIAYAPEDAGCAERLRDDLEAAGYGVWRAPGTVPPGSAAAQEALDRGVRGSAALILIWSAPAARHEMVARARLRAARLQKPVLPVRIDDVDLPATLVGVPVVTAAPSCAHVVARLRPHLPPPDSDDALLALAEDLAHRYIRRRKAGLRRAVELLGDARYREPLLALLEDLAREDPVEGVRQMARQVLDARARAAPDDAGRGGASRHVFGARCDNGHVTYFDKRRVCPDCGTLVRRGVRRGGMALDELALECGECGCEIVVTVDCEGYK